MKISKILLGESALPEQLVWLKRKETWLGDRHSNIIRLVALVIFTLNEMVNYHVLGVVNQQFHTGSLILVALWVLAAAAFDMVLRKHWIPRAAPYVMVSVDVFLLTWLLFLGNGPRSPLVGVYFLIVVLSALRLNQHLVFFTSLVSAFGYVSTWDFARHQRPENLVPIYHVVIVSLCLILAGIVLCHAISRAFSLIALSLDKKV